jgi:Kef-type K+ transport system membrane component KefB
MTSDDDLKILHKIKSTHGRVAIIAGVIMGLALSSYFFTFGMLIDQGATAMLWFQIVTMVLFIFGLIFLKRLAFFITRIFLALNGDCRRVLKGMKLADLEKA